MKGMVAALALSLVLFAASFGSAFATLVNWDLAAFNGNQVRVYYAIDNQTLKTESFTIDNQSDRDTLMYIDQDGVRIFEMLGPAHAVTTQPYVLNFQRVPATDHDDPNSVRYPRGISMGARWPAY